MATPWRDYEDYESILAESDPSEPNFEFDENDIYKIHYTSGTTGKPRGVLMTYRNRMEQIAHVFMNADTSDQQGRRLFACGSPDPCGRLLFHPLLFEGCQARYS